MTAFLVAAPPRVGHVPYAHECKAWARTRSSASSVLSLCAIRTLGSLLEWASIILAYIYLQRRIEQEYDCRLCLASVQDREFGGRVSAALKSQLRASPRQNLPDHGTVHFLDRTTVSVALYWILRAFHRALPSFFQILLMIVFSVLQRPSNAGHGWFRLPVRWCRTWHPTRHRIPTA